MIKYCIAIIVSGVTLGITVAIAIHLLNIEVNTKQVFFLLMTILFANDLADWIKGKLLS